jgi:hypothetical protein
MEIILNNCVPANRGGANETFQRQQIAAQRTGTARSAGAR